MKKPPFPFHKQVTLLTTKALKKTMPVLNMLVLQIKLVRGLLLRTGKCYFILKHLNLTDLFQPACLLEGF